MDAADERGYLIRAGTWDRSIFETVLAGEYGSLAFAGKTVVDIGAHIGGFSMLAALGGARRVVAYEACADNYALLVANCDALPIIECHHAAVWRSDAGSGVLTLRKSALPENTGGASVVECASVAGFGLAAADTEEVKRVPFDDIVREAGPVDLLKIDAEGSEYPILLTSRMLDLVHEIVGEYHVLSGAAESSALAQYAGWNIGNLGRHLTSSGFVVELVDKGAQGLFRAFRPEHVSAQGPTLPE